MIDNVLVILVSAFSDNRLVPSRDALFRACVGKTSLVYYRDHSSLFENYGKVLPASYHWLTKLQNSASSNKNKQMNY